MNINMLKNALFVVTKGASNNKFLPVTSLVSIEIKDAYVSLMTYDGVNYVIHNYIDVNSNDLSAIVDVNQLNQLISKLNNDVTIESSSDNSHIIISDGKNVYKLNNAFEGDDIVKMPDFEGPTFICFDNEGNVVGNPVDASKLLKLSKVAEASALKNNSVIELTGLYMSDYMASTNGYNAFFVENNTGINDKLFTFRALSLLSIFGDSSEVKYQVDGDYFTFYDFYESSASIIMGKTMPEATEYPYEQLKSYLYAEMPINVTLAKADLLESLSRLKLFVTAYDANIIELNIENNNLILSTLEGTAVETIGVDTDKSFTCKLDVNSFETNIKNNTSNLVLLGLGNDSAISIFDDKDNITKIVSIGE